jgi:hypothetical protein
MARATHIFYNLCQSGELLVDMPCGAIENYRPTIVSELDCLHDLARLVALEMQRAVGTPARDNHQCASD